MKPGNRFVKVAALQLASRAGDEGQVPSTMPVRGHKSDSVVTCCDRARSVRSAMTSRVIEFADAAAQAGVQVLVLQELADLPYFPASQDLSWRAVAETLHESSFLESLRQVARQAGMVIVASIYEREDAATDNYAVYSSAVVIDADGTVCGRVRKGAANGRNGHFEQSFFGETDEPGYAVIPTRYARIGVTLSRGGRFFQAAEKMWDDGAELIVSPRAQLSGLSQASLETEYVSHAARLGYPLVIANRVGTETAWPWLGDWSGGSLIVAKDARIVERAGPVHDALIMGSVELGSFVNDRPGLFMPAAARANRPSAPTVLHS